MTDKCPRCGDLKYTTRGDGRHARAEVCSCATHCPLCDGQGFVFERNDTGYTVARRCRCGFVADRVRRFNQAELPARYHDRTVESFQALTANQKDLRYFFLDLRHRVEPGDAGVLLIGNPGTGKTHLMAALVSHLTLERGLGCRYIEFMDLLSRLRNGFNENRSSAEIIGPLVDVPMLVIDELGKGRGTEWELSVLDELISKRYNTGRSTFFATNFRERAPAADTGTEPREPRLGGRPAPASMRRETLEDRVGPRILSRLHEMCQWKTIQGPDYRRRIREARRPGGMPPDTGNESTP